MIRKGTPGKKETVSAPKLPTQKTKSSGISSVQSIPRSASEKQPRPIPSNKVVANNNEVRIIPCNTCYYYYYYHHLKLQHVTDTSATSSDRRVVKIHRCNKYSNNNIDEGMQLRFLLFLLIMVVMAYFIGYLYFKASQQDTHNKILLSAVRDWRTELEKANKEYKKQLEFSAKQSKEYNAELQNLKEQVSSLKSDHQSLIDRVNELQNVLNKYSADSSIMLNQLDETFRQNQRLSESFEEAINVLRVSEEGLKDKLQLQQYVIGNMSIDKGLMEKELFDRMIADNIHDQEMDCLKQKFDVLLEEKEKTAKEHEATLIENNAKFGLLVTKMKKEKNRMLLMDKLLKKKDTTIKLLSYQVEEQQSRNNMLQATINEMSALAVPVPQHEEAKTKRPKQEKAKGHGKKKSV